MRLAEAEPGWGKPSYPAGMVHGSVERRMKDNGQFGLFATALIARGTPIFRKWHEDFYTGVEGWISLTTDEVLGLPPAEKSLFMVYGLDQDFRRIIGPVNDIYVTSPDNFVNHSCAPNLKYDLDGNVVAAQKIRRNDELLIDYGFFAVNFDEEFECECRSRECRRRVTRNDWKRLALRYGFAMPRFLHKEIARLLAARQNEVLS